MTLGIVTISYNQAQFLEEAIQSVTMKDRSQLRYVIVDPGSKDGSREMIEKHKERFEKIIFEPDNGPADGLNKGFAACDADVYGYISSDDRFAPGALDWVMNYFAKNPRTDVLLGAVRIIDQKGKPRLRKALSWNFTGEGLLTGTATAVAQATFFRKRAWLSTRGYNPENKTCWDWELLIDMLLAGAIFDIRYKVLGDFRIHEASITHRHWQGGSACDRLHADEQRIMNKLSATGIKSHTGVIAALKRLAFKFNPYRRWLEVAVT